MISIRHALSIEASSDAVYRALTAPEGLAAWWTRDVDAADQVGGTSTFRFSSGSFNRMRIVTLKPAEEIVWECVDGAEEWIGTRVVFLLLPTKAGTHLDFRHDGWAEATPYMQECSTHWLHHLESLKGYLESGIGRPDGAAT